MRETEEMMILDELDDVLKRIVKFLGMSVLLISFLCAVILISGCSNPNQPDNGWETEYPYHSSMSDSVYSDSYKFLTDSVY